MNSAGREKVAADVGREHLAAAGGRRVRPPSDCRSTKGLGAVEALLGKTAASALSLAVLAQGLSAEAPAYPVKVSANGRYFVDQLGQPVFWLGTTQWQLTREYSLADVRTIVEESRRHGFTFAQVMVLGVGDGTAANVDGERPWASVAPLTPNEAYFRHVDAVLDIARENHLIISLTLYHQRWRELITERNARDWARWLARRYRSLPNIVWSMTPEAKPEFVPVLRELATGLEATAWWIDARTGESTPIGKVPCSGLRDFTTPEGWEDALLVVE